MTRECTVKVSFFNRGGASRRLILDMINYPKHVLADCLVGLGEPTKQEIPRYNVRDIFQFVEKTKSLNIIRNIIIYLIDLSSLFTKVTLNKIIEYSGDYVECHNISTIILVNDLCWYTECTSYLQKQHLSKSR